ncbi:unnamed protein product, partial [Prorocentrum cordatum]
LVSPVKSRRPPRAAAAATAADGPPSASRRADARRGRRAAVMAEGAGAGGGGRRTRAPRMAGGVRSPLHTRSRNSGTEQDRSEARRGRRAGENAQDRLRPRAGRGPGRGRGEKRICREQQQEEQEGVAAAAQQGPRRRLAAAAQKMMSSSFFVLSSALGTSRADTGAGIARPLASSSFLSAIFSRSIFAFFFSTTFLTLKNSSRSISSISCVMYWMVSSMRGIRTYCRAFTRRLVILISSSRVLKAHCNEASLIRATIDLK